jgi:Putative Flp pilus-assembly TadE/G-like
MITAASKRGQALVLIVFAIIGLIAMVALAIDGGNVFAEKRKAQSAVDDAALAAALANVNNQNITNAVYTITQSNPTNKFPDSVVSIHVGAPFTGCNGATINITHIFSVPDPNDSPAYYIQVMIRSSVDTYFGPVVGIRQLKYCVQAIARGKPVVLLPLFYGNAIVAADCSASGALTAWGSGNVITKNGGAFSNSNATDAVQILKDTNLVLPVNKSVTAVGGINAPSNYSPPPNPNQTQLQIPCPMPSYMIPHPTCTDTVAKIPWPGMTVDANGYRVIPPGVYCVTGDFDKADYKGTEVTFVMLNNGITWNGNVDIHLSAPTDDTNHAKGLLIFLPPPNSNPIKLNGTSNVVDTTGSVFAPLSQITLTGDFLGNTMNSQWVGAEVDMTGSNNAVIEYDQGSNWLYAQPPVVELNK